MKLFKRLISALLILAMVCGNLGFHAHAEEIQEPEQTDATGETVPTPDVPEQTDAPGETVPALDTPEQDIPQEETTASEFYTVPFQFNPLYEGQYTGKDFGVSHQPAYESEFFTQATNYLSMAEAGKKIRSGMKNRQETIEVAFLSTNSDYQAVGDQAIAEATRHTGNPQEGDYLMWQYAGWTADMSREYDPWTSTYKYRCVFYLAYYTTAQQEAELTVAVNKLLSSLNLAGKSDYQKISAVYDYICKNIRYDYANLNNDSYTLKHTAYAALMHKTAVCQGYALLFYRLMLELGIDCRIIAGDGGGPHGWNIVQLEGLYFNMDATWDEGSGNYIWFLRNTWDFANHERYMEYDTIAFHNEYPMAAESYTPGVKPTMDPYVYSGYCGEDITNVSWWLGRDGSITFKGTGNTYNFSSDPELRPFYTYWENEIVKAVVEDGVTGIGDYSFYNLPKLQEVVISGSVRTIGASVFADCGSLTSITLAEGLERIGSQAFKGCRMTALDLPTTLKALGDQAFYDCNKLQSISIPGGVTELGSYLFDCCKQLTTVTLGEGIAEISTGMFRMCSILKELNLPGTLTRIGEEAFLYAANNSAFVLPDSVTTICASAFRESGIRELVIPDSVTTIGERAFENTGNLESIRLPQGLTVLEKYLFASSDIQSLEIPGSVTVIREYAFQSSDIASIVIPEGVKRIEDSAFRNCLWLTDVTLPQSLEYLSGFEDCTGLTRITIPDALSEIGNYAFCRCYNLAEVTIPESVTVIGKGAFEACTSLTELHLPQGLSQVPKKLASGCSSLTQVTIPQGITVIGDSAFASCEKLTDVTIPQGVQTIGDSAFQNCHGLTRIIVPDSVTTIEDRAFEHCSNLEQAVVYGDLGYSAFHKCYALKDMQLKGNITAIGNQAFSQCYALETITIPATVTSLGMSCFQDCKKLAEIRFLGDAPTLGYTIFDGVTATAYYPANNDTWTEDVRQNYSGTITWLTHDPSCDHDYSTTLVEPTCTEQGYTIFTCEKCADSYEGDFVDALGHDYVDHKCTRCISDDRDIVGTWMDNITFRLDVNGTLTISGTGEIKSNANTGMTFPWNEFHELVKVIIIDTGVTGVPHNCFGGNQLTSFFPNLVRVEMRSVEYIEHSAFQYCKSLETVVLSGNFRRFGSYVFDSTPLKQIYFQGDAPEFLNDVFQGVTATAYYPANNDTWTEDVRQNYGGTITWVALGEDVPVLQPCGDSAFWNYESGTLTISGTGATYDYFGNEAATPWNAHREQITSLVIEEGITHIGSANFAELPNLTQVSLPGSLTQIGNFAFMKCGALTAIDLPDNLTGIGQQAFFQCGKLEAIEIPASVTFLDAGIFEECSALTDVLFLSDPDLPSMMVGNSLFRNCQALEEIRVEDGHLALRSIGGALYIDLGNGELSLNSYPAGRKNTELRFADNTVTIDQFAVENNPYLTSVTFPASVAQISGCAFMRCGNLQVLRFEGSAPLVSANAFFGCNITIFYPCGDDSWEIRDSWNPEELCGSEGSITWEMSSHNMTQWIVTKEADCLNPGTEHSECVLCGYEENREIPALGHDYTAVVTAPGCDSIGYTTHTCSRCGDSYTTDEIPALGHDYTAVVTAPGCDSIGYTTHTCSRCGDSYTTDEVPALGHDWDDGVVTKEATETETGIRLHTCSRCGATEERIIPTIDHVHNYESVITAPTCTDQGFTTHTCRCGDSYVDTYVSATGHNMSQWIVTAEADCVNPGTEFSECVACDYEESREIPALGHDYTAVVTAPGCDSIGYTTHTCSRCGDSYTTDEIPALGHQWDDPNAEEPTCVICGYVLKGFPVSVNVAEAGEGVTTVWVDGVAYSVIPGAGGFTVNLPTTEATNLVIYTMNENATEDVHTQYPTGMKVWMLKFENGAYTATYIPEFDNLLTYAGSSIRIVGVKGIRMITSVSKATKKALTSANGLAGYTLVEYGTALGWAGDIDPNLGLTLGQTYTKSNYAYKKGVADPVFKQTATHIQYTNVLVGFDDDKCIPDIAMRPYIILEDAEGNQVTIYGGMIYRSIGYIAWQNRAAFQPKTAAYEYVWGIIHHVYGDQFDADYKK